MIEKWRRKLLDRLGHSASNQKLVAIAMGAKGRLQPRVRSKLWAEAYRTFVGAGVPERGKRFAEEVLRLPDAHERLWEMAQEIYPEHGFKAHISKGLILIFLVTVIHSN